MNYHVKQDCKNLDEAITYVSRNKDVGEIKFIYDLWSKYEECDVKEAQDYLDALCTCSKPWSIIASKAVGRRSPEIVVQRSR